MVQVNVAQLLKEPIGSIRDIEIEGVVAIIAGSGSPVQGEVELTRTDRGVLAKGTLNTVVEIACSRCLSMFQRDLKLRIEEEYLPVIDVLTGKTVSFPNEPDILTIDEHHVLDLSEMIRQYALLVIPMKPLCREDCAGLCPGCGHNLNQGTCDCPRQDSDPRWSKLKKLVLTGDILVKGKEGKG